jgi:molecular chaperone GrpE (heat shock protein)
MSTPVTPNGPRRALLQICEEPLPLCAPVVEHPASQLERDLRALMRELGETRFALAEERREQREQLRSLLLKVLDAVDVLEAALRGGARGPDPARSARQLLDRVLQGEHVERLEPELNESFDPHRHRVSETRVDAERADGSIAEVALPGWRWRGELLRKAAVVVVRSGEPATPPQPNPGGAS